jgi:TonB family protein
VKSPVQKQSSSPNAAAFARNLERQIKADPQNAGLYYDLYEHYTANSNTGAAEKTLENLIKKNPDETKGYYLLGKIQYRQRDLKNAEKNLGKVFTLQEKAPVEEFMLLEAKVYQILTILLRGDRTKAYEMFAEWSGNLTEERIRFLDLEEQDRGILRGIAESQEARAEIEEPGGEDEGETGENAPTGMEVDPSGDLSPDNIVPLEQVDTPPVLKERVNPKYPAAALERKIEGIVVVNALISETGDVLDVVVVQGLAGGLNEETVKAVMQWKYEPAVKDGQKVKVRKPISITFKARELIS